MHNNCVNNTAERAIGAARQLLASIKLLYVYQDTVLTSEILQTRKVV